MASHVTTDPGISTLPEIFDPVKLGKLLQQALPNQWGRIQDIELQILKHHPGKRCTFEIALRTTRGCHSLIGRVYAEGGSDVYQAMEEISRAGFGLGAEFAIPRPMAFLEPLRLLLYEKAVGPRPKVLILNPNESKRVQAVERCARWLARFHNSHLRSGRVVHLNEQVSSLKGCSRCLADVDRPFADKASRLFDQLPEIFDPVTMRLLAARPVPTE